MDGLNLHQWTLTSPFACACLPRLKILICYWSSEHGLESFLETLVDNTAANNLNIESIFILCVGMLRMLAKVADTYCR